MSVLYNTHVGYLGYLKRLKLGGGKLTWAILALSIAVVLFLNCIIFGTWVSISASGIVTSLVLTFILIHLYRHRFFIKQISIRLFKNKNRSRALRPHAD